jgi:trehalose 6-phosphate synthase/phosphatase
MANENSLGMLDPGDTSVLLVSNVLPLDFTYDDVKQVWSVKWCDDVGGLGWSGNGCWSAYRRVVHVGVPNAWIKKDQRDGVEELLRPFNCVPVFLEAQEAHEHYQGWCKGVIWPLFHNIVDLYNSSEVEMARMDGSTLDTTKAESTWIAQKSWNPMSQEKAWPAHKFATSKFARAVEQAYCSGDIVWIQDYHLLLLPSFLMRKIPEANVGLFLHVPFPSSEIFRTLSFREEILRSMLCADHVRLPRLSVVRWLCVHAFILKVKRILPERLSPL